MRRIRVRRIWGMGTQVLKLIKHLHRIAESGVSVYIFNIEDRLNPLILKNLHRRTFYQLSFC
jgi:hypothetical protein